MAIELKINTNAQDIKAQLAEIKDQLDNMGDSGSEEFKKLAKDAALLKNRLDQSTKAINDQVKELNKIPDAALNSKQRLAELEDQLADMGDVGSTEYQKMAKEAGILKRQIDDSTRAIDIQAKRFSGLQVGVEAMQAIGGAAQLATGTMAMLGTENEAVTKSIERMVAIQSLMNGVQEVSNLLSAESALGMKVRIGLEKTYAMVVGKSTGAMKAFKVAVASTGIGFLVVGLGMLIANFDKVVGWVQKAIDKFRDMGPAMKILLSPITLLIAAYDGVIFVLQKLGIVDDEQTKAAKKNVQERIENQEKERATIGSKYDYEIQKAQAAGENTFELEQQKRQAFIDSAKVQMQLMVEQAKLNGELTEEQKEAMIALKDETIRVAKEMNIARIKENKRVKDEEIKNNEEKLKKYKETQDEKKKIAEEDAAMMKSINDIFKTEEELKLEETKSAWDKRLEFLKEKVGEESELFKKAEIKKNADLQAIKDEFELKEKEKETKKKEELIAKKDLENQIEIQKLIEKGLMEDSTLEEKKAREEEIRIAEEKNELALLKEKRDNDLISLEQYELAKAAITNKRIAREKQAEEEKNKFEKDLKKQQAAAAKEQALSTLNTLGEMMGEGSAMAKASAVADTTMNTYKAAMGAYSSLAPIPIVGPALGAAAAGIAVGAGVLNVKKILSTKAPGKGGGGGGGGSVPSAPKIATPNENSVTTPSFTNFENELSGNVNFGRTDAQPVMKAVIDDSELSSNEAKRNRLNLRSTL